MLAPAGSGKTKTLVSRVAELVGRGVDPGGILMLAFNRKAAEQLEERLAALGIATTRRLGAPADASGASPSGAPATAARPTPPGVHCATFNAFGYRYQREVCGARIAVDLDGAAQRALMRRAMDDRRRLRSRRSSPRAAATRSAPSSRRSPWCAPPWTTRTTVAGHASSA